MPPVVGLAPYPNFFDPPKKKSAKVRQAKLRMPSWENVEEAINFTVLPKGSAGTEKPELFAASRQAKSMAMDGHGRQSVRYVTELQFPPEKYPDPDIRKLNRALKNLCDDVKAATDAPVRLHVFEEKPPPPPTDGELKQRQWRERVDKIGHAKPVAAWPLNPEDGNQTVSDLFTNSVLNVTARGGVLKYPETGHARSRHEFYHPDQHWYLGAMKERDDDAFANSIFRARNLAERRTLHARPLTAPPSIRRQVMQPDGSWGGQWEDFVPAEQHLAQRDWRYPKDLSLSRRKEEDPPLGINEFFEQSVFKHDARAEMARKAREQEEENRATVLQRERIAKEEYQRRVEEQEREELRERHQGYLALQKLQLEREIAEEEYRKEQRETERIHALREQRAREAEEAARRRQDTLMREAEEQMLKAAESDEAQRRFAERRRQKEEEEAAAEELRRQRRLQEQQQLEMELREAERQKSLARERAEQLRIEEAARRREEELQREARIAQRADALTNQQLLEKKQAEYEEQQRQLRQAQARLRQEQEQATQQRQSQKQPAPQTAPPAPPSPQKPPAQSSLKAWPQKQLPAQEAVTVVEDQMNVANVHARPTSPASTVIIRRCGSAAGGNVLTHIHIHGACHEVLVEGCQRLVVLLDQVTQKVVVSGCDQVRLSHGGVMCKQILIRSSPRTIVHAVDEQASTELVATESPASGFILAPARMVKQPATPQAILACVEGEQVVLKSDVQKNMVKGKLLESAAEKQKRLQDEAYAKAARQREEQLAKQQREEATRLQQEQVRREAEAAKEEQRRQQEAARKAAAEQAAAAKAAAEKAAREQQERVRQEQERARQEQERDRQELQRKKQEAAAAAAVVAAAAAKQKEEEERKRLMRQRGLGC